MFLRQPKKKKKRKNKNSQNLGPIGPARGRPQMEQTQNGPRLYHKLSSILLRKSHSLLGPLTVKTFTAAKMAVAALRRQGFLLSRRDSSGKVGAILSISALYQQQSFFVTGNSAVLEGQKNKKGKWFTLPPFAPIVDAPSLGKVLSGHGTDMSGGNTSTTALKWVIRCCPQLPRSLIQKLFRLRQVWFSVSMYWAVVCDCQQLLLLI